MQIKEYLKNKQPILYKTFLNAINNNQLSHAYLIIGETGTPLKDTAIYLAKSLLCDNKDPLACENCITCIRVDEGTYADIIIYDGDAQTIGKKEVDLITSTFSRTAQESKGIVIYVIHLVENMTPQATNALLKFLEEPGKNTYAFLTTQNEARILPTIVSRSQRLTLRLSPREDVINECSQLELGKDDIELLSYFYNEPNSIKERALSEEYQTLKDSLNLFLHNMKNKDDLLYALEDKILSTIESKEDARLFIDMLSSVFEDIIRKKNGEKIFLTSYDNIISDLSITLPHIEATLLELMNLRSRISLNVSIPLIFIHLANYIPKE